jgi:hypothetical protein
MENLTIKNIINILNNSDNYNISISLNAYEKEYILKLFNNTSIIFELETFLKDLLFNDTIDYHDIPHIIYNLSNIYNNINNNKIDKLNIIRFITECIILTHMPSLSNEDILIIDKLINSSLNLLLFNYNKFNNYNIFSICCKRYKDFIK